MFALRNRRLQKLAEFSKYDISTCAIRTINAVYSEKERERQRSRSTQLKPVRGWSKKIKVYDRKLCVITDKRNKKKGGEGEETSKFSVTRTQLAAVFSYMSRFTVITSAVTSTTERANNNRWTTVKFQERASWKEQVRSILGSCKRAILLHTEKKLCIIKRNFVVHKLVEARAKTRRIKYSRVVKVAIVTSAGTMNF